MLDQVKSYIVLEDKTHEKLSEKVNKLLAEWRILLWGCWVATSIWAYSNDARYTQAMWYIW